MRPVVCPQRGAPQHFVIENDEAESEMSLESGLPHSLVKQAENSRVRELVKKIENHLIDNLFNEIYNKTMPTTHLVRSKK